MWNFLLLLWFIRLSRHVAVGNSTGRQTPIKLVQINIIKELCCTWYLKNYTEHSNLQNKIFLQPRVAALKSQSIILTIIP